MSIAVVPIPEPQPAAAAAAPFTLAVDIGGSSIKASVLDGAGKLVAPQLRTPTPKAATPQAIIAKIADLAVTAAGCAALVRRAFPAW